MVSGNKIAKREFTVRCESCAHSPEPGWLPFGRDDWVQCPNCSGGYIKVLETKIEPTRKIFITTRT